MGNGDVCEGECEWIESEVCECVWFWMGNSEVCECEWIESEVCWWV